MEKAFGQIIRSVPPEKFDSNITNSYKDFNVTTSVSERSNISSDVPKNNNINSDKVPLVTELEQNTNGSNNKVLDKSSPDIVIVNPPAEVVRPELRRSQRTIKPPNKLNL